jgi:hypothetical protein
MEKSELDNDQPNKGQFLIKVFEITNKALDSFVIGFLSLSSLSSQVLLLAIGFSTFFLRKSLSDLL